MLFISVKINHAESIQPMTYSAEEKRTFLYRRVLVMFFVVMRT